MLSKLIYSIGFDWAIRVAGFIVVGLLIFATITIDARLPPRKSGRILDFGVFKDLPFTVYTFGAATVWLGLYLPIFVSDLFYRFLVKKLLTLESILDSTTNNTRSFMASTKTSPSTPYLS